MWPSGKFQLNWSAGYLTPKITKAAMVKPGNLAMLSV
jgi:hypothetical protein